MERKLKNQSLRPTNVSTWRVPNSLPGFISRVTRKGMYSALGVVVGRIGCPDFLAASSCCKVS